MGSQIALGGKGNRCDGIASTSYFDQGPYKVGNVKLEHTCSICFPKVVGDQLIIRAHIFYPQTLRVARALERSGCEAVGRRQSGPWPLAVISSGFLVGSDQYRAYAERLASYGYVAVLYDKVENINSTINDEVSSLFVTEIINWCSASPIFQGNLKTEEVYLIGHSRGGKVSLLAAEADDRVGAVLLLDPVDSNSYAPEGPGYPSAIRQMERLSGLPIAIVGGGRSGDCIPQSSNYERFFEGSPSSLTLELSIRDAGHFQFLGGRPSMMQTAVCSAGKIQNETVRDLSRAVMVAWAESMVSGRASSDRKRVGLMNASIGEMKEVLADRGVAQEGAFEFRWKA